MVLSSLQRIFRDFTSVKTNLNQEMQRLSWNKSNLSAQNINFNTNSLRTTKLVLEVEGQYLEEGQWEEERLMLLIQKLKIELLLKTNNLLKKILDLRQLQLQLQVQESLEVLLEEEVSLVQQAHLQQLIMVLPIFHSVHQSHYLLQNLPQKRRNTELTISD